MRSRISVLATRGLIAAAVAASALFGYGCSSNSKSLGAQFTASATPATAGLVKLVANSASGPRVVVSAVIYGPATLDMYSFDFDVAIGDTSVLAFVPGSAAAGSALTATGAQTVTATANVSMADPTHVVVSVHKNNGGTGNDVAGASAIIVTLAFDGKMAGTSTLAIATTPAPSAKNSANAAIGAITFDSASGSVTAVSSGGGPY
jgi:hypothetical protein